jgi:Phytanoyl-CoA dioxygenase (PhyH)
MTNQIIDLDLRHELLERGFIQIPQLLDREFLNRLKRDTEAALENQTNFNAERHRTTGSMAPVTVDEMFAELITYKPALDALARLGYPNASFSDGWIISKPGHTPQLFWHYDWFAWEDPISFEPEPPQLFLMYYLTDTTRQNGALRVIPGTHYRHNALHDVLSEPHSEALQRGTSMDTPEFSQRPDEVDVCVQAGDLLIGDARILHASHANQTDARRTLITLWYQPNLAALPEPLQAQMSAKTQQPPETWSERARNLYNSVKTVYIGDAAPYQRSLYQRPERKID